MTFIRLSSACWHAQLGAVTCLPLLLWNYSTRAQGTKAGGPSDLGSCQEVGGRKKTKERERIRRGSREGVRAPAYSLTASRMRE